MAESEISFASYPRLLTVALVVIATIALVSRIGAAPTQNEAVPDLFTSSSTQASVQSSGQQTIVRARLVNVDLELLGSSNNQYGGTKTVRLNLFPDASFVAVPDRVEVRSPERFTWIGHVEGVNHSQVTMVVRDGTLAGNVDFPGGNFQVRYAGDGVHALQEIDPSAFPPEAEPMSVDVPADFDGRVGDVRLTDDGSSIDVLVVYTSAARQVVGGPDAMESLVQLAVAETNNAFANSAVNQRLRLVHTAEIAFSEANFDWKDTLIAVTEPFDGAMDEVHALRDSHGADLVSLFVSQTRDQTCGIGWVMQTVSSWYERLGFSVVAQECAAGSGNWTFAHELGHNMGSQHNRINAGSEGAYPYSYGYQEPGGNFHTIMAYWSGCAGVCPEIKHFSNPAVAYNGQLTGINHESPNAADNARSLNNAAFIVANFRSGVLATATGTIISTPTTTATPTQTRTPTVTDTPTNTATPTFTPTLTPTATPVVVSLPAQLTAPVEFGDSAGRVFRVKFLTPGAVLLDADGKPVPVRVEVWVKQVPAISGRTIGIRAIDLRVTAIPTSTPTATETPTYTPTATFGPTFTATLTVSATITATNGSDAVSRLAPPPKGEPPTGSRKADASSKPPDVPHTTGSSYARLAAKAIDNGAVRVIVGLNVAFRPEGRLASVAVIQSQRASIIRAQDSLVSQMSAHNLASVHRFRFIPYLAFEVDASGLAAVAANPQVTSIEEDAKLKPALAQSVPLVGADTAWAAGYSGFGQAVVVLDTGVDTSHPFLAGRVVSEACYSTNSQTDNASSLCQGGSESKVGDGAGVNCTLALDGCDHGTHVTGIAAGSGLSSSGVAKDASIIAIQVFSQIDDFFECEADPPCILAYERDIIRGLERVYALRNDFAIAAVNLSLGGGEHTSVALCDADNQSMKGAIDTLRSVNIAVVAASGNEGFTSSMGEPACISSAISVGATTKGDAVAPFSSSASWLDLLAPGFGILSSVPGDRFKFSSGTSMSAPHVAGAWAVLKSKLPDATVDQVLHALSNSGVSIVDQRNGLSKPRIQVDAALAELPTSGAGTPSATPTRTATITTTPTITALPTLTPVRLAQPAVVELIFSSAEIKGAGLDERTVKVYYSSQGITWTPLTTTIRSEGGLKAASVSVDHQGLFSLAGEGFYLALPTVFSAAAGGW